ncbi:MAG: helix-turn-helix domain-containing protein [Acidobacteria bacterium]|nr:helix-turn-helix domain-containing protein [Acidobacteriota bacterium]
MRTVAPEIQEREVVRCHRCQLVQFRTLSDLCRRCTYPLPPIPRWDAALAADTHRAPDQRTPNSAPFAADRSLARSDLQLRGKTAREFTIGRRLRELREQKHLTQQEMAVRAGVPRTYISRIENARLLPGPLMLHRIADALSVAMLDLLPHNQNGNGHLEGVADSYWTELVQHFSHLRSEQILLVLSHARSLVGEGKSQGLEAQLVAG